MSLLWLLPLAITVAGLATVLFAVVQTAGEAERLRTELRTVAGLRPLLIEVQGSARALASTLAARRQS